MTLLLSPLRDSKTGRLQVSFPTSLYFYAIPSEEPGSLTACTPDTICAHGSKREVLVRGSQSTSEGSGPPKLPQIATHCNQVYRGCCRVRTRMPKVSLDSEREWENPQEKNSSRVGSSLHHLWLKKILCQCSNRCQERIQVKYHYLLMYTYTFPKYSLVLVLGYRVWGEVDLGSDTVLTWQGHLQSLQLRSFSLLPTFFNMHPFLHVMETQCTKWNTITTLLESRKKGCNSQDDF